MTDLKDQIEARAPELARALLDKAGVRYRDTGGWLTMCSPLRTETKPSFGVSTENGHYQDFGTGDKGDVFHLAGELLKLNPKTQFPVLLDECAGLLGISTNSHSRRKAPPKESPTSALHLASQYGLTPADFRSAGWMPRTLHKGAAIGYHGTVVLDSEDGGYKLADACKYKSIARNENGKRDPWFRPSLKEMGATGADCLIAPRGSLERLADNGGLLVLAGGEEKALACHKAGFAAASPSAGEGGVLSERVHRWLKDLGVTKIVLAFDADDAGVKGAQRFTANLQAVTRDVVTVQWEDDLPSGYDINDVLLKDGLDGVRAKINSASLVERLKGSRPVAPAKLPVEAAPPLWEEDDLELKEQEEFHPDLPEFPVDALPDAIRRWAEEMANCYQVPRDLPAMLALGAISAAVCGKYRVSSWESWRDANSLFIAVFLPPGERKSPPTAAATAPIYRWQDQKRKINEALQQSVEIKLAGLNDRLKSAKKAAGAGDSAAERECMEIMQEIREIPKPAPDRLLYDDATVEALAQPMKDNGEVGAIVSDEGKIFDNLAGLYSGGVPSFQFFLKSYDGSSCAIDRVSRGQIILKRPTMTLCVAVQPGVLDKLANTSGSRDLGLMGRFLYAYPKSKMGARASTRGLAVSQSTRVRFDRIMDVLLNSPLDTDGEAPVVIMDPSAQEYFQRLEVLLEVRLGKDGDLGWMTDWSGKLLGKCMRIAGLIHCVRHAEGDTASEPRCEWLYRPICRADVEAAWRICEYAIEHAKAVYRRVGFEPRSADLDARHMKARCLEMEAAGREISMRSLRRSLQRRFLTSDKKFDQDRFIDTLDRLRVNKWLLPHPDNTGRREAFVIHPQVSREATA